MTILRFLQAAGVRLRSIITVVDTWLWRRNPKPANVFYFRPGNIVPVTGTVKLFDVNRRAWVVTESGAAAWVPVDELFKRAA